MNPDPNPTSGPNTLYAFVYLFNRGDAQRSAVKYRICKYWRLRCRGSDPKRVVVAGGKCSNRCDEIVSEG